VRKLLKSFKTEINPTPEQKVKINKTIGTCRYIYNFYLATQKERYERGEKLQSAFDFSKWLNNDYLPQHEELSWIKEVSSKAVARSVVNAYDAYQRFFKKQSKFPKFKKKGKSDVKMYFVKTDSKATIFCERHRIKIPTLGWVKIKEKGYIPTTKSGLVIKSGTVSIKADRYYVSVLVEVSDTKIANNCNEGIGIDLGIKDLAIVSNGKKYKNINKSARLKKLEKQLRREQRCFSRKYENLKKGESTQKNIQKQKLKVQKLYHRISNIRTDYINKTIAEIVKTKPSYITIEDLNVSGMMKNKHLSKAVASQKFYEFRTKLKTKCNANGIELRVVDRFYPSSKLCHCCGSIKKDLKLSDRIYKCECGYVEDRDFNASLNLRDAKTYEIA
jgi:putative transposase